MPDKTIKWKRSLGVITPKSRYVVHESKYLGKIIYRQAHITFDKGGNEQAVKKLWYYHSAFGSQTFQSEQAMFNHLDQTVKHRKDI